MKKVYSTTLHSQAEILRVVLRDHGIDSLLENENSAMYAAGVPIPAIPFVISVADEHAEEAARIVLAELTKERAPVASAIHVRTACACGKTLEYPQGEEPPEECPWCGRLVRAPAGESPAAPARMSRPLVAVLVLGSIFVLGLLFYGGFPAAVRTPLERIPSRSPRADGAQTPSIPELARSLRERMDAVRIPPIDRIDPAPTLASLTKEFPEEAARFDAMIAAVRTVDGLAETWLGELVDHSPDWAMEAGLAESPRLERYAARAAKTLALFEGLLLRRLREIAPRPASIDERMFERQLERNLLAFAIFGADITDPRAGLLGIQASYQVKDKPALLAQRLEDAPGMLAAFLTELKTPPRAWIDLALRDLNDTMQLLQHLELTATDARVPAAVAIARSALADYATRLRALRERNHPVPVRDARWIAFLMRDAEFTDRSPKEGVRILLEEAERSYSRWSAFMDKPPPATAPFTPEAWMSEVQSLVERARQLTLDRGVAEVPADELPKVASTTYTSVGSHDWPYYTSQPLASALNARLWIRRWNPGESATASCSSTIARIHVLAETFPGRHLHDLLSRRSSLVRRTCGSFSLVEGWHESCIRWALETLPDIAAESAMLEGHRFVRCWTAAVETAFLSGALTERQAIEMLMGGVSGGEDEARERLAWATLNPTYWASAILGERDILRLRGELKAKAGFDLKRFHTRLLGYGSTPIALVREDMLRDPK